MPSTAAGVLFALFTQLSQGAFAPEPTPAAPPASQIQIASESPAPTPAGAPAAAADRYDLPTTSAAAQAAFAAPQSPQAFASPLVEPPRPADLMRTLVGGPTHLTGTPLKLADVLETARDRREQTERTIAYWQLAAAMVEAALAERQAADLIALRQEAPSAGALWDERERQVDLRIQLAEQEVRAAQQRLAAQVGIGADASSLPLAADMPHCGRYETRYDEIFAGQENTAAEGLSRTLALRHQQLKTQAAAVAEAAGWLTAARQRVAVDPGAAEDVVRAHDQLSLRLADFVETAGRYNGEIASYAAIAAPGSVGTERLVAMLIRTSVQVDEQDPGAATPVQPDPAVMPATALEPFNNPPAPTLEMPVEDQGRQRQGLFGDGRTEVRRPLIDRFFNREHSILRRRIREAVN